ncbi:uncharacterized protein LOC127831852 [Dreissena polymorpha]|uniref:Cystatin domain-containing protein n=1 Tax=Dreissena polymorpha TaxID=45954 RepID=A0A9D4GRT9_DREPO|nr:uncharacterized protein LOC127831852 [Dreissena polymorpha]KAH3821920.1 hypothetical protein DPMN_123688 [Dreissena polymorpha]
MSTTTTTPVLALLFLAGLVASQPGNGAGNRGGLGRRPGVPMPGGLRPSNVNDATIQSAANTAVQRLGSEYSLIRVNSASTQVVAGTLYHLELAVSKTTSSQTGVKNFTCNVKVVEQPVDVLH